MNDISRLREIHLRQIKVLGAISSDISRPRENNLCLLKALGSAWALQVCFVFFVGVCTSVIWSSELLWTLFMSWFKRTAPTFSHTSRYEITPMCRGEGKSFWNLAHLTSTPVELLFWVQRLCFSYQSSYYFMDWACAFLVFEQALITSAAERAFLHPQEDLIRVGERFAKGLTRLVSFSPACVG